MMIRFYNACLAAVHHAATCMSSCMRLKFIQRLGRDYQMTVINIISNVISRQIISNDKYSTRQNTVEPASWICTLCGPYLAGGRPSVPDRLVALVGVPRPTSLGLHKRLGIGI